MIPYIVIIIFAVVGLILWGLKGLLGGLVFGYLFSFLMGLLAQILTKKIDVSIIKGKYRIAIAAAFVDKNLERILSIHRFSLMDKNAIIDQFSKYINEIFDSAIKISNPIKKQILDLDYSSYKENFARGGREIWLNKFKNDQNEYKLMGEFIEFCLNEIYEEFQKYSTP